MPSMVDVLRCLSARLEKVIRAGPVLKAGSRPMLWRKGSQGSMLKEKEGLTKVHCHACRSVKTHSSHFISISKEDSLQLWGAAGKSGEKGNERGGAGEIDHLNAYHGLVSALKHPLSPKAAHHYKARGGTLRRIIEKRAEGGRG